SFSETLCQTPLRCIVLRKVLEREPKSEGGLSMFCRISIDARRVLLFLAAVSVVAFAPCAARGQQRGYDQSLLKALQWRSIGPHRGGRSTAVAGVTSQQSVFYF